MDIQNIKTFIRVAELKSFTKTANEMNFVQSTVTMQIKHLEKELGYPLFDRIGKKISLTNLGSEFLNCAYELIHVLEKAENLSKNTDCIHGVLRIGISNSLLFGVLIELLPDFKARYHDLDLQIKTGHTTELIEQLKQNRLDMVYIAAGLNTDPDLLLNYSKKEKIIFLCGKNHPLANQKNISFETLAKYNFLTTEHEGICFNRLCELASQNNVTVNTDIELDNLYAIIELVKEGLGLAFLPECSVEKQLSNGELVHLNTTVEPQEYYSQILLHKGRWISPFMAGLIETIKEIRP